MDVAIVDRVFETSVSLGVLAVVLIGLYRLTNRMIDVVSIHIEKCCESLERIADALGDLKKE